MVRLIEWADVLAENFAPRVMENWRLDHDDVLAINPRHRVPAHAGDGSRGTVARSRPRSRRRWSR